MGDLTEEGVFLVEPPGVLVLFWEFLGVVVEAVVEGVLVFAGVIVLTRESVGVADLRDGLGASSF